MEDLVPHLRAGRAQAGTQGERLEAQAGRGAGEAQTDMIIALIVVGWLVCGVYAWGTEFAYFQGAYPTIAKENYREDLKFAVGLGLLGGPLAALVSLFMSGFNKHGWRPY